MRTPLGEVRGLGSAKRGTEDFIASRVTSVALALLTVFFIGLVICVAGRTHAEVVAILGSPLVAILLVATALLTAHHMRLGMQVVIEDYVHTEIPKFALLIANWMFSWGVALTCVFAVLKIAFGA